MRAVDIIEKKRDGGVLTDEEIGFFVQGVAHGAVPEYQAAAWLMAVRMKGMEKDETVALTRAMLESGSKIDTSGLRTSIVDKHSTGGVGDKTSIILAPLAAAMGIAVPMMSGRGLGHTGGTLDKLESIPGIDLHLTPERASAQLAEIGCCVFGQSERIAPADRVLYALRDATATVDSIPLIAASIMSKKLAEGLDGMVLDVKVGSGAFMKDLDSARQLAKLMVEIGNSMGVRTVAVLTDMHQPLGRTVGNALELKEAISALRGKWADDLREVTLNLAAWMVNIADAASEDMPPMPMNEFTRKKYVHEAMEFIEKGDALKKFVEMVDAQGGDAEAIMNQSMLPTAMNVRQIEAAEEGYVRLMDAEAVGRAAMLLGAGRASASEEIDPAAGIIVNKKVGAKVAKGEILAIMHYNDEAGVKDAEEALRSGIEIGMRAPATKPIIYESIR